MVGHGRLVRSEKQVELMLARFKRFGKKHKPIDEMRCEINALEYVLGKRDDLL